MEAGLEGLRLREILEAWKISVRSLPSLGVGTALITKR